VHGTVDPHGATDTNDIWQYGPTRAYGSIAGGFNGFGGNRRAVSAILSDLAPGTVYHYRFTATSSGGRGVGKDRTFKTLGAPRRTCRP
jgi:phosphodiesterase/alkaline phosphatase D-like protein